MEKRRVVVTGIGAITPLGNDAETTWNNLVAGVSGIGPLTRVNADDFPAKVAAEVKDFDPRHLWIKKMQGKWIDLHNLLLQLLSWL